MTPLSLMADHTLVLQVESRLAPLVERWLPRYLDEPSPAVTPRANAARSSADPLALSLVTCASIAVMSFLKRYFSTCADAPATAPRRAFS